MRLSGCAPQPLAHYLKALGILRLVSEQLDPLARGSWSSNTFALSIGADEEALEAFFLEQYSPTPIVAPWNGGSGFAPRDNRIGMDFVRNSSSPRLTAYREAIDVGFRLRQELGITDKADDRKDDLILACRDWLPDVALTWMDAALVLTSGGLAYPPILGTGGNDGRLDFSNNFMQRIAEVFGAAPQQAFRWLRGALWGTPQPGMQKVAVGQFLPSAAGGANGTTGFEADSLVNPWDF
ncbi:MAG: type I-G CRISPR-associated protein Cas8g1/Csx17, partial [Candidatus Xenobia bacterium]